MNNLPNIDFSKPKKNPTVDAETSLSELTFYKDREYFSNLENFVSFVKAVERSVRQSKHYSRYIAYLKEDIGLRYCQVLSNIDHDDAEIEMHHGPILNLFDCVAIVVDYLLYNNKKINTFIVTDIILDEHYHNRVAVVMLSKTVHEQVHENNIFINVRQAFGDMNAFLHKYRDGVSQDQITKINKYIKSCETQDSSDNGVLELNKFLTKWGDENNG